jgi:hypothetical protein
MVSIKPSTPFLIAALAGLGCGTGFLNKIVVNDDTTTTPHPEDTGSPPPPDDGGDADDTAEPEIEIEIEISPTHPRLFFSTSDVPRLQAQIFDFERAEIVTTWDRIITELRDPSALPLAEGVGPPTTDDGWADLVGPLPTMAMYALFTEDAEVYEQTFEWMRRLVALEDWGAGTDANHDRGAALALQAVTTSYDMLHDQMSITDRMATRAKIIYQATALHRALTIEPRVEWADHWTSRDAQTAHAALMMAGLVTEHDYASSADWLARARTFVHTTVSGLETIGDGSWPEGPSMAADTLTSTVQLLRMMERHFGLELNTHPWIQARSMAMLRTARPGGAAVMSIGDGNSTWLRGPEHIVCFVDGYATDHGATLLMDQHLLVEDGSTRKHELWLEFLWCDPLVEPLVPTPSMSKTHHFEEWGVVTWHSGFLDTDSSLIFKSGPPITQTLWSQVREEDLDPSTFGIGHLHPDAGSFGWYPKGMAVITMGGTQSPKRTALSNTYTFTAEHPVDRGWGPWEHSDWWTPTSFFDQVGDLWDVGQLGEWGLDFGPAEDLVEAAATIELVDTRRGVTVMGGQFGSMYPNEFAGYEGWWDLGIQRMSRFVVITPEQVVLVFDHIDQTTTLTHKARFNSTTAAFSISGTTGYLSTPDGNSWAVDALTGGSLSTAQLIQRVEQPGGPWSHQLVVSNSTAPGHHHHLTALRSSSQSVSLTRWEPIEGGVEAELTITSDGVSSTYGIRLATDADPLDRQSFLGFNGFLGLTPGAESEIRF